MPAAVFIFHADGPPIARAGIKGRVTAVIARSVGAPVEFQLVTRHGYLGFQTFELLTIGGVSIYHGAWYPQASIEIVSVRWNDEGLPAPSGEVTIYWE